MAEQKQSSSSYTTTFSVEGMTCASCVRIVERSLKRLEGIEYVSVNLATEKAMLLSDRPLDRETLENSVAASGYTYREQAPAEDVLERRFKAARRKFSIALAVTVPLMVLMLLHMSGIHLPGFLYIELAAAAFVLAYPGASVFRGAWIALSHRHTNMDTLVALGATFSWGTVLPAILGLPIFSFGSIAAMLIAFHLTGRYIESRLKYRAAADIHRLIGTKSTDALLLLPPDEEHPRGRELPVPVEAVKPGAVIMVKSGQRIPLDGTVAEGSALVDYSMITGEPIPQRREPGDEVIGGTLLTGGMLTVEVTKTAEDTFLANMIKLIEEAQAQSVPIQAFADRLTNIFIPVVLALALAAALVWGLAYPQLESYRSAAAELLPWIRTGGTALSASASVFVAVLVIACPCALGLATPMALIAGSGAAARRGIIIRDGEAIQGARSIDVMLLDKTGTITEGRPTVAATDLPEEILLAVAAIERYSTHPLAAAVVEYAEQKMPQGLPEAENVTETAGSGISGVVSGHRYSIGRPGQGETDRFHETVDAGATLIAVRVDDEYRGAVAVTDRIKPEAAEVIATLQQMQITPVIVTGDRQEAAEAVAREIGIAAEHVHAGLYPEDKLTILQDYQKAGRRCAMVGDGINDAAVLRAADLGIALGTGTDLSIESADAVIVSGSLTRLPDTMDLSRLTFAKIRQNLFWALIYNMVALPLAMAGLLHPAIAEIAMTGSSINVILNSMRIRKFTPRLEEQHE